MADKDSMILHRVFGAVVLAIGALFAVLIAITPAAADDLFFMIPDDDVDSWSGPWEMMMAKIPWVWQTQSGRLGNFVALLFLYLLPRLVAGIITGACVSFILFEMCSVAGVKRGSVVSWLMMAVIVFAYPWYDYLTQITYSVNYVWAAAAVVGALWCFLNSETLPRPVYAVALIWTFASGWMHEGFGAPFCCGLTLWLVINRQHLNSRKVLLWIFACAGTMMTAFSPTFWSRSQNGGGHAFEFPFREAVMQLGPAFLVFLVFMVSLAMVFLNKRMRIRINSGGLLWIAVGGTAGALAVFLKYYSGPRTGAPLMLFSALGCGLSFRILGERSCGRCASWLIGIPTAICACVNLLCALVRQTELNKECHEVKRLFNDSSDGTIYMDLIQPSPDASLFKTTVRQFHEKVPIFFWEKYHDADKHLIILPVAIKDFTPSNPMASHHSNDLWIYDGHIIVPADIDLSENNIIMIMTSDGSWSPSRYRTDSFVASDGNKYILLTPHMQTLNPKIRIIDVDLGDRKSL